MVYDFCSIFFYQQAVPFFVQLLQVRAHRVMLRKRALLLITVVKYCPFARVQIKNHVRMEINCAMCATLHGYLKVFSYL